MTLNQGNELAKHTNIQNDSLTVNSFNSTNISANTNIIISCIILVLFIILVILFCYFSKKVKPYENVLRAIYRSPRRYTLLEFEDITDDQLIVNEEGILRSWDSGFLEDDSKPLISRGVLSSWDSGFLEYMEGEDDI